MGLDIIRSHDRVSVLKNKIGDRHTEKSGSYSRQKPNPLIHKIPLRTQKAPDYSSAL